VKLFFSAILVTIIFIGGLSQASAATRISCEKTTITKVDLPTGSGGSQHGDVTFADGRYAILFGDQVGFDQPSDWKELREGDHALVCADMKPFTQATQKRLVVVIDYDANLMFKSIWGPEGA
jgi:hypothetical protein